MGGRHRQHPGRSGPLPPRHRCRWRAGLLRQRPAAGRPRAGRREGGEERGARHRGPEDSRRVLKKTAAASHAGRQTKTLRAGHLLALPLPGHGLPQEPPGGSGVPRRPETSGHRRRRRRQIDGDLGEEAPGQKELPLTAARPRTEPPLPGDGGRGPGRPRRAQRASRAPSGACTWSFRKRTWDELSSRAKLTVWSWLTSLDSPLATGSLFT